jgi:hypothetical protein
MKDLSFLRSTFPPTHGPLAKYWAGRAGAPVDDIMLERTIMRRILVLASAAAVAMLALSPLAQAQTPTETPVPHSTTVHKKAAHMTKAKKKAPVKHKVAAKKVVKKKKPAVRTSAAAPHGIQA